jgi:hypothetical protein
MLPQRALGALSCVALALACGSDPATPKAGQHGTSNDVLGQVEMECTDYARRLCQSAAACCNRVTTFVEDDCVDYYVAQVCVPSAQLVAAGLATYDATSADDCLAAQQRSFDICLATWDQEVAIRLDLWASCHVIDGNVLEGGGCDNDARCAAPPEGVVGTSICRDHHCAIISLLEEGDPCPFPDGNVSTCNLGLYCTAPGAGEMGTCVPSPGEGEACEPKVQSLECGLGSYCDLTEAVCKKATNMGGPTCNQGTECASFVCDRLLQTCSVPITTAGNLCKPPL